MQNIWNLISNLGIKGDENTVDRRAIMLSNQLNFVMLVTMILLLAITVPLMIVTNDPISYGTYRVEMLLLFNIMNMGIAWAGLPKLSKLLLIFLPPVIFLLAPTLYGYVEEESYTYYPYVVVCASIVPHLLLNPAKERALFWISLLCYFLLTIFIDMLMVKFSDRQFPIEERINTFYPFYKIAQVILFIFVNASIYYLRMLNLRFENELARKNVELDVQNAELVQQKSEIERQKDELVKKETSTWQKLVSIISHEIVNSAIPINNLAGMSSQMLEDDSGAVSRISDIGDDVVQDIHTGLKIIESRTMALINLVKSTKSLSQIPRPVMRDLSIRELFERLNKLFHVKFREKGIRFHFEIDPENSILRADLELIESVLINLIQNAIEAMEENLERKLIVSAWQDETKGTRISVSDTGKGISEDVIEKIFLPFYSTKPENSGIGLSLAQQIMMLHNARLEVTPSHGAGATFTMIF
jgi:signal transduction histidine kinase